MCVCSYVCVFQPLQPCVHIWDSTTLVTLQQIGLGTFQRGVGSVAFSFAVSWIQWIFFKGLSFGFLAFILGTACNREGIWGERGMTITESNTSEDCILWAPGISKPRTLNKGYKIIKLKSKRWKMSILPKQQRVLHAVNYSALTSLHLLNLHLNSPNPCGCNE